MVSVNVSDTGCGIGAQHLPHVFDRLYRVDPDRSHTTGGAGLGLAIVKSIAISHGGSIQMSSQVGKGTQVNMRFPTEHSNGG